MNAVLILSILITIKDFELNKAIKMLAGKRSSVRSRLAPPNIYFKIIFAT